MAVHAIDVQQLDFARDALDVGCEIREVGGEDRRRDLHGCVAGFMAALPVSSRGP
jgi:hypothetical protein